MASTCAYLDPPYRGGWAVAAAVARHHLPAPDPLMAACDSDSDTGTSVDATERLRATRET